VKQFHLAKLIIPCECAKDNIKISDALHEEEHRRMYVVLSVGMGNQEGVPSDPYVSPYCISSSATIIEVSSLIKPNSSLRNSITYTEP